MEFVLSHTPPSTSGWITPGGEAGKRVLTATYLWNRRRRVYSVLIENTLSIYHIHIILIFRRKTPSESAVNARVAFFEVDGFLHPAATFKAVTSFYLFILFNTQQLTRPQPSHLRFQTKVRPGQTLYFGISLHWREVIMNINMYSWLFIQLLLCRLWCPVERVPKQCTINGREQSQRKYQVFFHNCLPALLCLKINLIWSLLRNG